MQPFSQHILIVDDDTRLRNLLGKFLGEHKMHVTLAKDLEEAKAALREFVFDLAIIDVTLPYDEEAQDGIEFTTLIRKTSKLPIIILTARGEPDDRIKGLEAGADDYLPKPFEPRELLLRINNIFKRAKTEEGEVSKFGDFTFDAKKLRLMRGDEFIHITESEARILALLCKEAGNLVSRERMSALCGGIDNRSIDVQITRLRRRIEVDSKKPRFLQTVRNQGYVLHT